MPNGDVLAQCCIAFLMFSSPGGLPAQTPYDGTLHIERRASKTLLHSIAGRPRGKGNAAAPAPAAPPADAEGLLSAEEMRVLLKGNSSYGFVINGDSPYREYYAPNGAILGNFKAGKWSIEDDTFCTSYPGLKRWCAVVRRLPTGAYAWEVGGEIVGYMKVLSGNPFEF